MTEYNYEVSYDNDTIEFNHKTFIYKHVIEFYDKISFNDYAVEADH